MQVIDDDNLSRRCNLSLVLNSLLLDRDLTATWGKLHHVRGKFASGNNSVEVSLQAGRKNSELFRRIGWSSFVLLSEFLIQVFLIDWGRLLLIKLCINWSLKNWINDINGKILDFLKSGSV